VLEQISQLSGGRHELVHLSDWAALAHLPRLRSSSNTHELLYPGAPDDDLADPNNQGHLHRRPQSLMWLEHGRCHNVPRLVLDHADQAFIDIRALLRAGRCDGKTISQVICHVAQWINPRPTKVSDRENNKPQLWRDFIPALEIEFSDRAPRKSRDLQRHLVCKQGLY
jgi:hypothetical protein